MATRTTTQAGPISLASTFGGSAFSPGDNIVAAHALTIDQATIAGSSPIGASATGPSLAKTTGGALPATTYNVRYTHVDAGGNESDLSPQTSLATDASNNRLAVTLPTLPTGVSSYNIYTNSGQLWFKQVSGAGAGVSNIDSISLVTGYAPVYAIKVTNAVGRLIINANLTIKGSMGLEGTTTLGDTIVTQAAGTIVEFDGSAAPNTTLGYQVFMGGFTSARKSLFWKSNGTANSRCAIRSNAGGGNAYFVANNTETGAVDLNFTDVTRIGTATIDGLSILAGTSAQTINFANCVFSACGRIFASISLSTGIIFTVTNNTWKNSPGTENFRQGGASASPTGARTWVGNVTDKLTVLSVVGLTVGGTNAADVTIFLQLPTASGGGVRTPASINNVLFRNTTANQVARFGDWVECVCIVDGNTLSTTGTYSAKADIANPHWTTPSGPTGMYAVTSCLFESFGTDDQGDVDYGPNTTGFNSSFSYCIGLPEDRDSGLPFGTGTLVTLLGFSGALCTYNHNTWYLGNQGAIALAEAATGFAGMCDELQSNIFWNSDRSSGASSTSFNRITYEPTRINNVSSASAAVNMVNAAKCGHNCRFNLYSGAGTDTLLGAYTDGGILGHSYHHYANTGTFGATDVTSDPRFSDPTARFWTWVKSLAGLTLPGNATPDRKDYMAYGLYKLSLKNETAHVDYDARYTLAAYKIFIRAGFAPTNALLRSAAHDGTDIGALSVSTGGHSGGNRTNSRRKKHMVGRTIKIQFSSADASTAAPVSLFDDNDVAVTLGANERLIIDTIAANIAAAVTLVTLFNDDNADAAVGSGERIAPFGANSGFFQGGEEGYVCPIGRTPKVKASGAGQVDLDGSGRIVIGTGGTVRPSWKEATHP